tara:strand:+ start:20523 stop:20777 length:255 start_codon:yes stop_codon:yes gene_type:complete
MSFYKLNFDWAYFHDNHRKYDNPLGLIHAYFQKNKGSVRLDATGSTGKENCNFNDKPLNKACQTQPSSPHISKRKSSHDQTIKK